MTSYQLERSALGHFGANGRAVAEISCMSGHTGAGTAPEILHGTSLVPLHGISIPQFLPSETVRSNPDKTNRFVLFLVGMGTAFPGSR